MKVTVEEFWALTNNWYQRSLRLRDVWQNENETHARKEKAFRLYNIMRLRLIGLMPSAVKLQTPKMQSIGEIGGITFKGKSDFEKESIMPGWLPIDKRNKE